MGKKWPNGLNIALPSCHSSVAKTRFYKHTHHITNLAVFREVCLQRESLTSHAFVTLPFSQAGLIQLNVFSWQYYLVMDQWGKSNTQLAGNGVTPSLT